MSLNYKNILPYMAISFLLTACGEGVPPKGQTPTVEKTPTAQTKLAKAQLGVLSEATVEIYELGVIPYKHLFTEKTSTGTTIEEIGNFNAHSETLDKDKFYLYKVSNGLDMDADDDGVIDPFPIKNMGTFHAIVKGESAKKVKGAFRVTAASELLYKKVKADINDTSKLEEDLDLSAKEVFQKDIDEDSEVTADDILQYNPIAHKDALTQAYQDKLPQIIKDIHEDKKQEVKKQAPTAEAGRDKSIMTGGSIELRASGTDLDGRIVSYEWSDSDGVLSSNKNFIYSADVLGMHILTLTVKDNDGLEATDRVNITVVDKPNTIPSANSATYTMDEDTVKKISLEGKDKEGDPLTYKVLVNPTYGTLSGKAPNLLYTPKANYNGKDRFIFVTNDGKADSKRAQIDIIIQKSNDKPVIVNDGEKLTTKEDTSKIFTLKAEDVENDKLTYTIVKKPTHGKLTHKKESFIYTPDANYNGNDSFIIKANDGKNDSADATIMITVTPVNDAPTVDAGGDKSTIVQTAVTLVAKGTDIDGNIRSYKWFGDAKPLGSSKSLNYTPQTVGSHTLSVTVTDNDGLKATDSVIVTATEQANKKPIAESQRVSLKENTTKAITLKATDADEDKLTYKIITAPKHGKLTKKAPNVIYTPNKNYFGLDSFVFRANDGKDDSGDGNISLTVSEVDTTAPIITIKKASVISSYYTPNIETDGTDHVRLWEYAYDYTDAGATATDETDGNVSVTTILPEALKSGRAHYHPLPGVYIITYVAVDKAGNKATATREVTIVKDSTFPVITFNHSSPMSVRDTEKIDREVLVGHVSDNNRWQHTSPAELRKVTTDIPDDNEDLYLFDLEDSFLTTRHGPRRAGTYTFQYRAFDDAGHETIAKFVIIVKDTTPPSIRLNGMTSITLNQGAVYTELGATAKDKTDGTLHATISGAVDTSKVGTYKITYTATDKAGNRATKTRTVKVALPADKTAPVITLRGDSLVTIYLGRGGYYERGATAKDDRDGTVKVTKSGSVNTSKAGTYKIIYTATDKAGNRATKTRTVKVIAPADTRAPRVTLKGNFRWKDSGGTLRNYYPRQQLTGTYREEGATAVDDRDGKVSVKISYGKLTKSLFVAGKPASRQGIYVVFYTAKDKAGNKRVRYRLVLKDLAAWYPSADYEIAVNKYIRDHFSEF